jgi:protein PhnA
MCAGILQLLEDCSFDVKPLHARSPRAGVYSRRISKTSGTAPDNVGKLDAFAAVADAPGVAVPGPLWIPYRTRTTDESSEAMSTIPACPQCTLENTYPDGDNYVCADCGHEWPMAASGDTDEDADAAVRDANGNVLADGDAVVLIKDLKVKGSSITLKMGTKVKSIRLVGGDHEVDCKMDAGSFMLKACYLRKA